MPTVTGVLETSLYVDDLERAERFYQEVMGFSKMVEDDRLRAFQAGEHQVLLLFKRGASLAVEHVPTHDGSGPLHLAFSIAASELERWEKKLKEKGVEIEAKKKWERGGQSLYFRDPDNHLLELVTPGCWPNY